MLAAETHFQDIAALYRQHHSWLNAWLRRKLGCSEQAADLAHDTFVRILNARAPAQGLASLDAPRAYLSTTAQRLLVDRARHLRIEQSYLAGLAAMAGTLDGAPSPEAVLIALQSLQQLSAALQSLPVKGREAFLLHYLEDASQPLIAARLGVSVRMVQKYLAQGLLRCHQVLDHG